MAITFLKYLPQLVSNFRRKSTVGWSIHNILLDFAGGLLSTLQLVADCADTRDWSGIVGDVAKFALGSISIVFDLLFMVQHYVLYPPPKRAGTAHAPLLAVQRRGAVLIKSRAVRGARRRGRLGEVAPPRLGRAGATRDARRRAPPRACRRGVTRDGVTPPRECRRS
ncbi:L-cystine transmembrane transporter [Aureococcus anophagefferens]|nr:L-cystine transmembrane transporter [Aureococcus anophagefferens]